MIIDDPNKKHHVGYKASKAAMTALRKISKGLDGGDPLVTLLMVQKSDGHQLIYSTRWATSH